MIIKQAEPNSTETGWPNTPRRRVSDFGTRLEVISVRCDNSHNLHLVARGLPDGDESQLLVRGLTERECRDAMVRCQDVIAEFFSR
ncbi:MAG: hypothetical protein K0U72_13635 [Gammaproteobacteria bacterium]|nr:hypothetical protein [Gammaproteobacteria bacterium]